MLKGATQTVEAPNHQGIVGTEVGQGFVKDRTVGLSSNGGFDEDSIATGVGECVVL